MNVDFCLLRFGRSAKPKPNISGSDSRKHNSINGFEASTAVRLARAGQTDGIPAFQKLYGEKSENLEMRNMRERGNI